MPTVRPPGVPLAGQWRFQLDREDKGIQEAWFNRALSDRIKLPGTLTGQGIGNAVGLETQWVGGVQNRQWFEIERYAPHATPGDFKFPFWLQPDLESQSMDEVWNSEKFQHLRSTVNTDEYLPPCQRCEFKKGRRKLT